MAKLVSKVYGDALLETAAAGGSMDVLAAEAKALILIWKANPDIAVLLDNPQIAREEKIRFLESVFKEKISGDMLGFLVAALEKGRQKEITAVLEYFTAQVKEVKKIGTADVASAVALSGPQQEQIKKRLLETTGYVDFEINYQVDPQLIGGMVIRIGDRVVDSSIKTQLLEMQKTMQRIRV